MKWLVFVILALVTLAVQATVGGFLGIHLGDGLTLGVDFLAIVAVLVALKVRAGSDALLAGWMLGLLIDLSSPRMPIGLYALTFALGASLVYSVRGAVYTTNPITQMLTTFGFCLAAHGVSRVFIHVFAPPAGDRLGLDLLEVLLLATCTAIAAPFIMGVLHKFDGLILGQRGQRRE
jgi:rod shape-determining protein MreD